jgi:hypothetical protein
MMDNYRTIADLGEKEIIQRLLRPLFNPNNDRNSVGDVVPRWKFQLTPLHLYQPTEFPPI